MSDFGSSREVVRNSSEVVSLAVFFAKLAEMCLNHSFPPRSCGLERPRFRWAKIGKFVEQFRAIHLHHERRWARFARAEACLTWLRGPEARLAWLGGSEACLTWL